MGILLTSLANAAGNSQVFKNAKFGAPNWSSYIA